MDIHDFKRETAHALKQYHLHVICVKKTPDEFEAALYSLLDKAIKAYQGRPPGMRHGIALDKEVTVILSQGDDVKPLCGIYFNLHSPYKKVALPKTVKPLVEQSPEEAD
jgi:hypothetical protein